MRVRSKAHPDVTGWASDYNLSSVNEMVVYFDDGGATSDYCHEYEYQLRNGEWVDHSDPRIVSDNHNTHFYEAS